MLVMMMEWRCSTKVDGCGRWLLQRRLWSITAAAVIDDSGGCGCDSDHPFHRLLSVIIQMRSSTQMNRV
ncbi:hypothetical protein L1987_01554 [Smallanthus sonchifolius]|uniref:Uncharacterized protein n=1 Tax=Smallanthus sonchifolius TaxID=185202 RepID=A0ACB9K5C6_9ASTR|nr:hypothetical protein L1987_01554 [Smallanthus sonchifolius]